MADLAAGGAFTRDLQVTVINYNGRLQLTSDGAGIAQVNVQDSSFWLDTVTIDALEIVAKGPASTSQVHLNEEATNIATLYLDGETDSTLSVDGIRAGTIDALEFDGANLFLTAEGDTAGTWTGPSSGAVNFVFTGGGGDDIFQFIAGSVDGMDQVFGGAGSDIVGVDITGMGVSGTAMSGDLHFEDTEAIYFINTGTAVIDASMMDGGVEMIGGAFTATTIHWLAGDFNGGGLAGNVTIYADPEATATYSNFGAGTQILYGSQAQGVGDTFYFGGELDDNDFVQGWDFDTEVPDLLLATFNGGTFAPQIQGVESIDFYSSGGIPNEINAGLIVGAVNWTLSGTQALTLNGGGVGTPINGVNGMTINASGLFELFTLDASNTAEAITLGSGGSVVNAWGGNDNVTGGDGDDTVNGGDGDDTIQGGQGADVLNGGNGNFDTFLLGDLYDGLDADDDTVNGGAGITDTLNYDGSTAITVTFSDAYSGTVTGAGFGTDSFSGIERIIASQADDTITGFHGYDLTSVGGSWRTYFGNVGNDTIDGGGSEAGYNDIVDYGVSFPVAGVFVNLGPDEVTVKGQTVAAGTATDLPGGFNAGTDTLIDIDGAVGSGAADILIGGSDSRSANGSLFEVWNGHAGNDIIAGSAAALSSTLSPEGLGQVNLLDYDMIHFLSATSGVRVNLFVGTAQDGQGGNDLLFDINQVSGTAFNDMLIGGNAQNDYFESFEGRQGDDYIDGRSGYDSARYQGAASGINADLSIGLVQDGDGGTDVLLSIEHLRGSAFGDIMKGSANNDVFEGMAGVDAIDGGAGYDRAEFGNSLNGVQVDLSLATGQVLDDGWGNVETLVGIEAVRGSIHNDTLTGGAGNDFFDGRAGDDTIDGGAGSADWVGYTGASGAVVVDLGEGTGTATGDGSDTLLNIERVTGSFYSDDLTGSDNVGNRLEGAASKYWTFANTGTQDNDTLTGGGGTGSDYFVFNSALDATNNVDTITDFQTGVDKIELDDAIFTGLLVGALSAGNFNSGAGLTAAADADDRLVYDTTSGFLYFDADGLNGSAAVKFAELSNLAALSASDFVIA
jgi:Ca2+-binding RTX toxin-like protein